MCFQGEEGNGGPTALTHKVKAVGMFTVDPPSSLFPAVPKPEATETASAQPAHADEAYGTACSIINSYQIRRTVQ
jgi:hypothetical protein